MNILVVGGGGREHAIALLECNCNVVLTDINLESLEKAKQDLSSYSFDSNIYIYFMDITSEESIIEVSQSLNLKNIKIDI